MLVVRGPVRSGLSCEKATKKRSVCACVCWLEGYDVVAHQSSPNGRHVAPIMRVLVLGERDGKTTGSRKSLDHLWVGRWGVMARGREECVRVCGVGVMFGEGGGISITTYKLKQKGRNKTNIPTFPTRLPARPPRCPLTPRLEAVCVP